jgi:signal transduction histidine kinase
MFSSLRSRLWLSYALLAFTALFVVAAILIIYLVNNPVANRQAVARLRADETVILNEKASLATQAPAVLQSKSETYDQLFNVRVIILDRSRQILADSRLGTAPTIVIPTLRSFLLNPTIKDTSGQAWLVVLSRLGQNRFLVLGVPRPRVAILAVLADELVPVMTVAGVTALLLSLVLAILLTRWITHPLQDVVAAARAVPSGQANPLTPHGPREVQELTRSFNEMAARVQASQKSQRDFVANVSHELKTPLTSVQGFAQAILDGAADTPEARRQAAAVIYDEAGRMHRLVLDLLDLARLDAGTADLQRSPVDMAALLRNLAEKITPQARSANVEIRVEAAPLPAITGDGDRLSQVFTNLVDNALKYTPAGGRITLTASAAGSGVRVDVADTGSGIPPEAVPHLFDRFYQVDPARQGGRKHGAGLGLTIAREIVQAHGGTISVRSTPGQGSTFSVNLPLDSREAATIVRRKK